MKTSVAVLVSTMALLLGTISFAPPAQAQKVTFRDGYDPGKWVEDIRAVKVTHGPRNVWVRTMFYPRANPEVVVAWLDTRKRNRGPEFGLRRHVGWPRLMGVTRVDTWRWGSAKDRRCAKARVWRDRHDIVMKVPRRCLRIKGKKPKKLRVSINAYDEQFPKRTQDWAPGRRTWSRWISS